MLRKKTAMFSEGLNIFGFDHNRSNSAEESSPNKESNDSHYLSSANELSTSKKMGHHLVSGVHLAQEQKLKQGRVIE